MFRCRYGVSKDLLGVMGWLGFVKVMVSLKGALGFVKVYGVSKAGHCNRCTWSGCTNDPTSRLLLNTIGTEQCNPAKCWLVYSEAPLQVSLI